MAEGESYRTAIPALIRQHLIATDPEFAQRQLAVEAFKLAGVVNVLKATKGHPRSVGSAKLAAYMRANGGAAAGFRADDAPSVEIEQRGNGGWL